MRTVFIVDDELFFTGLVQRVSVPHSARLEYHAFRLVPGLTLGVGGGGRESETRRPVS